jgi:hypothetical protein
MSHRSISGKYRLLRRIFGPVNNREIWKTSSNKELADLYEEIDLTPAIITSGAGVAQAV